MLHIISVGGSLIAPNLPDSKFLKSFKNFIEKRIKEGDKFILICGGGKTCRNYQEALFKSGIEDYSSRDWIGTYSTHLNAQLLKLTFGKYANPKLITDYKNDLEKFGKTFNKKILVGGGWKPGWSSDYDAVLMAKKFGAKSLINLSNIEYVYDKDPAKYKSAKKIENISWKDFRKIVGNKWTPGLNAPFDPIASKLAQKLKLTVGILDGKNLINLGKYMDDKKFIGTKIQN